MFNNELMADVHFIVGPPGESQRVPAHKVRAHPVRFPDCLLLRPCVGCEKQTFYSPPHSRFLLSFQYVLAVGSSVFGAMFYGDLAEGESEIHIPDVEPAAFLILLK